MKNNLSLISIILIFLFACTAPVNSSFRDTEIIEIKNTMAAYRDAWKAADSSEVLNKISNDITLHMPNKNGKPKVSKDSVAAFWFPQSDISYPITRYEVTNEKIEGSGSIAFYSGISRMEWHTLENGVHKDTILSVSEFLNVLKKENGIWKLYKVMYNLKGEEYK